MGEWQKVIGCPSEQLPIARGIDNGWSGWATAYPKPAHRTTSPPRSIYKILIYIIFAF
jgi:hypothetical protein